MTTFPPHGLRVFVSSAFFLTVFVLSVLFICVDCSRARNAAEAAEAKTKALAAKAGTSVGEHAGAFFAGIGEGVEKSVCDYAVRLDSPELATNGVSVTLVRRVDADKDTPALSLYLLNEKPLEGTLRIRLLAQDGSEIGRGEAAVSRSGEGADYLRFPVPKDLPSELVRTVALSLLPAGEGKE